MKRVYSRRDTDQSASVVYQRPDGTAYVSWANGDETDYPEVAAAIAAVDAWYGPAVRFEVERLVGPLCNHCGAPGRQCDCMPEEQCKI